MAERRYVRVQPTIVEALQLIAQDVGPKIVAKAVINVNYKKTKAEVYLWPHMLKKLLINKLSQELFQKRMLGSLK